MYTFKYNKKECGFVKTILYEGLLKSLKTRTKIEKANGIDVFIKQIPDSDEDGIFDLRVFKILNEDNNRVHENADIYQYKGYPVGQIRQSMGWDNIDITEGRVSTKDVVIQGENGYIPIRIYKPLKSKDKMTCLIFFHGGGFFGGSLDVVENPCKSIADKANCVVISVDYRLAPENPFPKGFVDCFDAVKYVYNNSEHLNINREKIAVSGDSAGGNLAIACALKDRNEKTNMIKYQALMYPVVILTNKEGSEYNWNISQYKIKNDDKRVTEAVLALKDVSMVTDFYLQGQNPENPYVSPLLEKDLSNLPKTLILTAEYDFLRVQGEVFIKKLIDSGVNARNIRYNGMDHAFIDKFGIYPQAEDCINEIVEDLLKL